MVGRLSRSLALGLLMLFTVVSTATGLELVVVLSSSSGNVAPELAPAPGVPCADALKALRAEGFRITDVQGGSGLAYTLGREGRPPASPAVVIVFCGLAEEAPPAPAS